VDGHDLSAHAAVRSVMTVAPPPRSGVASAIAAARGAVLEGLAAVAGYAILAVAVTWPLAPHLQDRLLGRFPNDGAGGAAWYDLLHREGGYHLFGVTHHTMTGAPLGWEQGNALNFQWLLPNYPGYLLADLVGGTAALNLVILAGLTLSGAAMYLLVRWLGCERLVAAWAGLVFLVFPWLLQRALAGHATLVHVWIFPLTLLAALGWLRRPSDARGLVVALAVTGAWLTSGYFGAMALVMIGGVALVALWQLSHEHGPVGALRRTISLWGLPVIATGVFAAVSLLAGGTAGIRIGRTVGELSQFGAHLRDFLPDPMNPVTGSFAVDHLARTEVKFPGAEGSLYPGFLTVSLAAAAIVLLVRRKLPSRRGDTISAALVAVAVLALLMAAPSPMRVFGIDVQPMPSRLLLEVVPSFRVPARFQTVLMTALVPLAAFGLAQLVATARRRGGSSSRARLEIVGICGAAMAVSVLELAVLPMPMHDVGRRPPVYGAIGSGVLAEYPLQLSGGFANSRYLFWQRSHGRPLLNGAGEGTPADAVRRMVVDPATRGTASTLAFLGVTSIITRPATYLWRRDSTGPDRASYGSGYTLAGAFPGGVRAWRVTAAPAPAIAVFRWDDVDEARPPTSAGVVDYPAKSGVIRLDVYAREAAALDLRLDVEAPRAVRTLTISGQDGHRVLALNGRTRLSATIAVPRGLSTLTMTLTPAGTLPRRVVEATRLSAPRLTAASSQDRDTALVPRLVSPDPGL
jgi:hypothetical protein